MSGTIIPGSDTIVVMIGLTTTAVAPLTALSGAWRATSALGVSPAGQGDTDNATTSVLPRSPN